MKTNNYSIKFLLSIMRAAVCTMLLAFCTINLEAQNVSTYQFSSSIGTPVNIYNTGTALTIGTGAIDDNTYPVTIPFTFMYHGTAFTTGSVCANGFIKLGGTSTSSYTPLTNTTNCISALGADLYGAATNHKIEYKTTGTTPNRVFRIQFDNWGFYSGGLNEVTFQIALYETTGQIDVAYIAAPGMSSHNVQVGLTGATVSDFNDRATTTNWSASTAGTTTSANLTFSSTVRPATGLIYTWNDALPCTGTPTAGTVVSSAPSICSGYHFILSLTGTTFASGLAFQWQSSSNGSTFTNIGGATSSSVNVTQNAATYYRCIVVCTNSAASSNSSVLLEPMGSLCSHSPITMNTIEGANFNIYPNPAQSEFTLDVTSESDRELTMVMYDVLGNKVKQEKRNVTSGLTSLKTNIEDFKTGMYFIQVTDADNNIIYSKRVIKQ